MAVESENVQKLMEWLAQGSHARSSVTSAEQLAEKLATVVFQGDTQWADRPDQVDSYRDTLRSWFAADGGNEQQFVTLTAPDADPAMFVDWFLQVVAGWEQQAGAEGQHPSAATQNGADPSSADSGRYSEPARDDNYGLTYRYDHQNGVYEWHDEASQTWRDQAWADQQSAGGGHGQATHAQGQAATHAQAPTADHSAGQAPAWDENWKMFYRVDDSGAYQFADAVTPGDQSSGCSNKWLDQAQVSARGGDHQHSAADPHAEAADALHNSMLAVVGAVFEADPSLKDVLTDEHIKAVLAEVLQEVI